MRVSSLFVSSAFVFGLLVPGLASAQGPLDASLAARLQARATSLGAKLDDLKTDHPKAVAAVRGRIDAAAKMREQKVTGILVAINGADLTLRKTDGQTLVVHAAEAKLDRRFGGKMVLADLQLNDELAAEGKIAENGEMAAKRLRDLSLQARYGSFAGNIVSVAADGKSFVLRTNQRGTQTILLDAETKIVKNGAAAAATDLVVGRQIRVDGVWNRVNDNVTARKVAITVPLVRIHVEGKVTALAGDVLSVLAADGKTYAVNLAHADVHFAQSSRMNKRLIQVGDRVDILARGEAGSLAVQAYSVRNLSRMNAKTRIVTMGDMNGVVQARVGDRLALKLGDGYAWGTASSGNTSILSSSTTKANVFEAKAVGQTDLTVNGDPRCHLAAPACATPSIQFRVTVNVAAAE